MKLKKNEWIGLGIVILLIVAVFVTGRLDRQVVWEDMPYDLLRFEDGLSRNMAKGDEYGCMNEGPNLTLPAGTYRIKWLVEEDGENHIRLDSKNGAPIYPQEIVMTENRGEAFFTLDTAAQGFSIQVMFDSGSKIQVLDIRLYSPMMRDHAFTFAFVLIGIYMLWVLYRHGMLPPARRGRLVILGMAMLIASGPALKDTICIGHDTIFHLTRICNLADGLAHGQFPVRMGGFSYNGYGAITSIFYPDIFLYGPALLMNCGSSLQYAVNSWMIAVNVASAVTMYVAAKRIFKDAWAATCASILYTLSIYRISDVFTRFAVGEMTAMIFLPIFLLGLYEVLLGDKTRWPLLGVSATCIFLSHMLSTLLCAVLACLLCVVMLGRIVREHRFVALVKAAGLAFLLCAFQIVPFLHYSMQGIGAKGLAIRGGVAYSALEPAQLFLLGAGELSVDPRNHRLATFALEIGLPLLMGAMMVIYTAVTAEKKEKKNDIAVGLVVIGALFAVGATNFFPWSYVQVLTAGLDDYLQFAWRLLMITAVFLALAGGYGCARVAKGQEEKMAMTILAVAAICALPTLTDETQNPRYIELGETVSPTLEYTEYTIPHTDPFLTVNRDVVIDGEIAMTAYQKEGTTVCAHLEAETDGTVMLPLFGFDGFQATLDGQPLDWTLGENNRMIVTVPSGANGELKVVFKSKMAWHVAEWISLITLIAMMGVGVKRRLRE